jgi:hypothetical protein
VENEAAVVVKKLAIDEIQWNFVKAVEQVGFKERDAIGLTFCEFNEFLHFWIHRVYGYSLIGATESTNEMMPEFAVLGVDGTALKPIPAMIIATAFAEVTSVVLSHALNGASFEDFPKLFQLVRDFGNHPGRVVINRELKEQRMPLVRSVFQRFHGEYSVRLKDALETEEWRRLRDHFLRLRWQDIRGIRSASHPSRVHIPNSRDRIRYASFVRRTGRGSA